MTVSILGLDSKVDSAWSASLTLALVVKDEMLQEAVEIARLQQKVATTVEEHVALPNGQYYYVPFPRLQPSRYAPIK